MRRRSKLAIALVGLAASHRQHIAASFVDEYPFRAAFISMVGAPIGRPELVVFPLHGEPLRIPIQPSISPSAYSIDGRALYGQCRPPENDPQKLALCRIDLKTGRAVPVPGSSGLYGELAVSRQADRILVAGLHRQDRDEWGLFELSPADNKIRTIFRVPDNNRKSAWGHLSISPDGARAVAFHDGRLQLVDINAATAEPLPHNLLMATWSPDGKWLAALENGELSRTILMDAKDLTRRRILVPSELDWSPDSHYLLGMRHDPRCGPYFGTLEVIDVETNERTAIASSDCQVNRATTGWVSTDITVK
jgi:hypothetical protein